MSENAWTEDQILANSEESFYFERKAGKLLAHSSFRLKLAKAISAFANSEGGTIALGVGDDGSFDGVEVFHKGNTATVEWLGDIVKNLVVPRAHAVHIKKVIPNAVSLIPEGKILITIDVEKSVFAPHQSTEENIYYYRVDKQSNVAPHNYIENLFFRSKFPGPKVADVWINSVINPILNIVANEKDRLENQYWGFDRSNPGTLKCAMVMNKVSTSPNWEQFFQHNDEILASINEHDRLAQLLINKISDLFSSIVKSGESAYIYNNVTDLDYLNALRDANRTISWQRFEGCKSRTDFVIKLFNADDEAEYGKHIVQCLINKVEISSEVSFAPLWNLYRKEFVEKFDGSFRTELEPIVFISKNLIEIVDVLNEQLKSKRNELCLQYGLPFEQLQQPQIHGLPSRLFGI